MNKLLCSIGCTLEQFHEGACEVPRRPTPAMTRNLYGMRPMGGSALQIEDRMALEDRLGIDP